MQFTPLESRMYEIYEIVFCLLVFQTITQTLVFKDTRKKINGMVFLLLCTGRFAEGLNCVRSKIKIKIFFDKCSFLFLINNFRNFRDKKNEKSESQELQICLGLFSSKCSDFYAR